MKKILAVILFVLAAALTPARDSEQAVAVKILFVNSKKNIQTECFSEAGAASADRDFHRRWAEQQNAAGLKTNIRNKLEQLFRCPRLTDDELFKDFAAFSLVISDYAPSAACYAGDAGVLNRNLSFHYDWAKRQNKGTVLANLLSKASATVDCLDREKQISYYTDLSLKLAAMVPISQNTAQTGSDEARKYFARGINAVETARSPADLENAIKEFEAAIRLSPNLAAAYFNLGAIQENLGRYEPAIANFKRYLQILPNAKDAQAVKELITKTEYKLEQKKKALESYRKITGVWVLQYETIFNGKRETQNFSEEAFYVENGELKMRAFVAGNPQAEFDGQTLRASWTGLLNLSTSPNPVDIRLYAVLNGDGTMTGTLTETIGRRVIRTLPVWMSRNLLNSGYNWIDPGPNRWKLLGGGRVMIENETKGFNRSFPKAIFLDYNRDFSLETRMTFISGDEGNYYGLMWGHNMKDGFYFFGVMANGNFAYRKAAGGNWEELLPGRPSIYVNQGVAANTLTVKKKGETMEFYINGTLVGNFPADKFNGLVGFHLNHYMKVQIDYLKMDY